MQAGSGFLDFVFDDFSLLDIFNLIFDLIFGLIFGLCSLILARFFNLFLGYEK